jgi:hypothetical protein
MLNQIANAITDFTSSISSHFISFLGAMAGVGILSMAIIQAVKDTFPVRRAFQRQWLRNWFQCKAAEAAKKGSDFKVSPADAEKDLIKLATDDNGNAFYDLPIEQLCGQYNAAIQVALDYAKEKEHRDLLVATAALASADDLRLVLNPPDAAKLRVNAADPNANQQVLDERQKFIDARTRVTHQVQRAIDSIQISAGFRWKFWLQCASFGLSALIAGLGVAMFFHPAAGSGIITVIVTGVLGGFLAPVARDLVAALQQLRK